MKKIIGSLMVAALFIALFTFMAFDSSLMIATMVFASVIGTVAFTCVAVWLIVT